MRVQGNPQGNRGLKRGFSFCFSSFFFAFFCFYFPFPVFLSAFAVQFCYTPLLSGKFRIAATRCICGERKGWTSWNGVCFTTRIERSFCIRLDSKARLVLPLEIRSALSIGAREKVLIKVKKVRCGFVEITLAKAGEGEVSRAYSRNGSYVIGKGVEK